MQWGWEQWPSGERARQGEWGGCHADSHASAFNLELDSSPFAFGAMDSRHQQTWAGARLPVPDLALLVGGPSQDWVSVALLRLPLGRAVAESWEWDSVLL